MDHPFTALRPEYTQLLAVMKVRPECKNAVDKVAAHILTFRTRFEDVSKVNGVPVLFMGPSFYRESDLNFSESPAQGDPWNRVSVHVPKGLGPYRDWQTAAIAAYHVNHLDQVGAGNWTWELVCFYSELFNGFGYRDYHHMHSPYLWGGTNIQTPGKYSSDGVFDSKEFDLQLGVIPLAKRVAELAPDLALSEVAIVIPPPQPTQLAKSTNPSHDTHWLQNSLKALGYDISVDGNYGAETRQTVAEFEKAYGLTRDAGYAGPEVMAALEKAIANLGQPA